MLLVPKNNAKVRKKTHLCKFKSIIVGLMSILPPVAETIDHKIFVSFFVNPSSSLPAGEGLFSDFTVTNKIPSPTIEVGVECFFGCVAE